MNGSKYEVLLLGLGNTLMSDDGVGLYLLDMLRKKRWPPGVVLAEAGTSILYFCEEISCSKNVIAVDAVRAGGRPGSLYRLSAEDMICHPDGWRDAHGFSLLHVTEIARRLRGFPAEIVVFGIEPAVLSFGNHLSGVVKAVLPKAANAVTKEVTRLAGRT